MKPALQEQFDRDFADAVGKVMGYALGLAKLLYGGMGPEAAAYAEELVHEAIAQTLGDQRAWNPAKVSLTGHLCGAVRSLFSNEAASAQARSRDGSAWESVAETSVDPVVPRPLTPEAYLLTQEACERIEADAYEVAGQDPTLEAVVLAVSDGAYTIDDIAAATGMTPKEVYAAKEKLKRRREAPPKKKRKS
ncbi:hypothetical protein KRR26_34440 [Corallococcus sp. M34]|uniref:hypothetical protein n=1 Tax=Citreicoccus inhibens TaxID=2849499 RepID=UPI001C243B2F|nr:hypothetical protein [Citreicoccus inhibens]MBU8900718.1 hypothetical protein [Citreicoccus inhibens]